MRPLRVAMLLVGLVPAVALVAAVAYGFVGPNTWSAKATVEVVARPSDVIALTEDVRKWRDWLLIDEVADANFETIQTIHVTGPGATLGWNTGFLTGDAQIVNEWEDASMYALDYRERRAGRPAVTATGTQPQPTSWTESEGALVVEDLGGGRVRLSIGERGEAGPRPLGPFLVAAVGRRHQAAVEQKVEALAALAKVRAERRELGAP